MIIGITGKKRHGKDFTKDMLTYILRNDFEIHDVEHESFAKSLKVMLCALTGQKMKIFNSDVKDTLMIDIITYNVKPINRNIKSIFKMNKNENYSSYYVSVREFMQWFGTEVMQTHFGKNIWINSVKKRLKKNKITIISDVRFPHEAEFIKKQGGVIIKVINPTVENNDTHKSETSINNIKEDYTFINDYKNSTDKCRKLLKQIIRENS